jgi:serine/threonine protein kinase/ABC-type amino acid transport substrate-binding protein
MPLEGTQLGNYQLLRPIGSGGMGEVYLAEDTRIHRQVAIKVIREEAAPYPDANAIKEVARLFQREMKAISQLDHPHILPLFDFGEETVNRTKLTYMVMPFRQEGSLADWLQKRSSAQLLSAQEVAYFVSQAADALQHAHDHQLIHQDVKPSNFLIRSRSGHPSHPDLLLADFGIAKFTTATATASQSIRGTPAYMAPEQWDGQPVAATDQYALAVMAYQLLTGRPPFLGGPAQVMRQHFQAQPQPPSTLNPRIPFALDAVILRALEKQPEARFASIAEFARAFQQAVQDAPPAAVSSARPSSLIKESPRPSTRGSDIRATLAISQAEALTGTSRTLTLPGGRRVTVPVPGGAHDGQVVRLEGQGEASPDGGESGALVLTILVAAAQEAPPFSPANAPQVEETLMVADPTVLATSHQHIVSPTAHAEPGLPTRTAVSQTDQIGRLTQPPQPKKDPHFGFIIGTVLLLVALIGGSVFFFTLNRPHTGNNLGPTGSGTNVSTTTSGGTTPLTSPTATTITPPNDLITPGTLTIGSDTTYPPQEYIDTATNQPAGFDIDLITAIAQRIGLKANIVTTTFDTILNDLVAKRFDVVVSAVSVTPERQTKVDFVPYFNAGESLLVQKGNPHNIKSTADLCGLPVGVQTGTIEQTDLQTASAVCTKAGKPAINLTVLSDQTAVVQLLANNSVVATYQDSPATDSYIKLHPGQFETGGPVVNAGQEGIVVRKGDTSMFNAVKAAFDQLKADGTYHSLILKWGLTNEELST